MDEQEYDLIEHMKETARWYEREVPEWKRNLLDREWAGLIQPPPPGDGTARQQPPG